MSEFTIEYKGNKKKISIESFSYEFEDFKKVFAKEFGVDENKNYEFYYIDKDDDKCYLTKDSAISDFSDAQNFTILVTLNEEEDDDNHSNGKSSNIQSSFMSALKGGINYSNSLVESRDEAIMNSSVYESNIPKNNNNISNKEMEEIKDLQKRYKELKEEIEQIKKNLEQKKEKLKKNEKKIKEGSKETEKDLESMKEKIEEDFKKENEQLEKEKKKEIAKLRIKQKKIQKELDELNGKIAENEKKENELLQKNEKLSKINEELEKKIENYKNQNEKQMSGVCEIVVNKRESNKKSYILIEESARDELNKANEDKEERDLKYNEQQSLLCQNIEEKAKKKKKNNKLYAEKYIKSINDLENQNKNSCIEQSKKNLKKMNNGAINKKRNKELFEINNENNKLKEKMKEIENQLEKQQKENEDKKNKKKEELEKKLKEKYEKELKKKSKKLTESYNKQIKENQDQMEN